jgi:lauroyl/myristoyl acyltransferase
VAVDKHTIENSEADLSVKPPNREDNPVGFVAITDISLILGLPVMGLCSILLPQFLWARFGHKLSPITLKMLPSSAEKIHKRLRAFFGSAFSKKDLQSLPFELAKNEIVRLLFLLGALMPFSGRFKTSVVGKENIEAALKRGKGVVLWDSHFYFASSGTKIALSRAGYNLYHLSHLRHGFSASWVGINVLNRIWVASELKFLAERIIIKYQNPAPAMKILSERLNNNAVISITVRDSSNNPVEAPFLNRQIRVAPGAPVIAKRNEAALLPVFTIRQEDGNFVTEVGAAIDLPSEMDTKSAVQFAVEQYAQRLEPFVKENPDQWLDWLSL